jgi:hypothetical protein
MVDIVARLDLRGRCMWWSFGDGLGDGMEARASAGPASSKAPRRFGLELMQQLVVFACESFCSLLPCDVFAQ